MTTRTAVLAKPQPGILADLPTLGRYLFFSLRSTPPAVLAKALEKLSVHVNGHTAVVGLGHSLVHRLGACIPGLRPFPAITLPPKSTQSAGQTLPANDTALWCWLRSAEGEDAGHLLHRSQELMALLAPALRLQRAVDSFTHAKQAGPNRHGHDLTGYEDGTENPTGKAARTAALVSGLGFGSDAGSFVAVQQWQHNFSALARLTPSQRDHTLGRRQSDNEELDDAPACAHVKRTAQESFTPEAFVLRRSMPWVQGAKAGLMFVAFGATLDAFEAQIRRMVGQDDGVVDALFGISKPRTGAYFWCPPLRGKHLDLSILLRQILAEH